MWLGPHDESVSKGLLKLEALSKPERSKILAARHFQSILKIVMSFSNSLSVILEKKPTRFSNWEPLRAS